MPTSAMAPPASQLKKPSIVAISGWIIRTPWPSRNPHAATLQSASNACCPQVGGENRLCSGLPTARRQAPTRVKPASRVGIGIGRRSLRGTDQNRLLIQPQTIGCRCCGSLAVDHASIPRAGVGLAGIDQHRTDPPPRIKPLRRGRRRLRTTERVKAPTDRPFRGSSSARSGLPEV